MGPALVPVLVSSLIGAVLVRPAQEAVQPARADPPAPAARALFVHGGRIHVGGAEGAVAEALLAVDGEVVAVGSEESVAARAEGLDPELLDLAGATAVPGLQDGHVQLEAYRASAQVLDLRDVRSPEELVARVAERAAETGPGRWVVGWGWERELWREQAEIRHGPLSEAVPDRSVALWSRDGRALLVNRMVLERVSLDGVRPAGTRLDNGRVLLDEEGRATGVLVDRAVQRVSRLLPEPTRKENVERLLAAQEELLSAGLTCVHDMGASQETIEIYDELRADGRLRLRVVAYLAGEEPGVDQLMSALPLEPDERQRLTVDGIHLTVDGSVPWHGAALVAGYADLPGEEGYVLPGLVRTTELVHRAALNGLQPALTARGDRSTGLALDSLESLSIIAKSLADARPRLECADLVALRDWRRIPNRRLIISMQPVRLLAERELLESRLGPERARAARAWWALAPEITAVCYGSGFPAADPDPVAGLRAARLLLAEPGLEEAAAPSDARSRARGALAGFTIGAAYAVHQEARRGLLLPGYAADLTILDVDPIACRIDQLVEAEVLATVIDGEVVYRRASR